MHYHPNIIQVRKQMQNVNYLKDEINMGEKINIFFSGAYGWFYAASVDQHALWKFLYNGALVYSVAA